MHNMMWQYNTFFYENHRNLYDTLNVSELEEKRLEDSLWWTFSHQGLEQNLIVLPLLLRVLDHGVATVRNPDILMMPTGSFTTSYQTGRRHPMGRVVAIKPKVINRGNNLL